MTTLDNNLKPTVGVSACLLGDNVRYDGGHKFLPSINSLLKPWIVLAPVCPEVSAGLGVPRPTIQLQQINESTRAIMNVGSPNSQDVSDALTKVADRYLTESSSQTLCGFIFKSRSPSCGLSSTPVHDKKNSFSDGLFAGQIRRHRKHWALVDESWLVDEERHFRFLSACYLIFHCHQAGAIDHELLACLKLTPGAAQQPKTVSNLVKTLLAENNKAAHWERLCSYWRERFVANKF